MIRTATEIMTEFSKLANMAVDPAISEDAQRTISLASQALLWAAGDGEPLSETITAEIAAAGK